MASSSSLLTKRTMGASSMSSRETPAPSMSSSPPETSRFSRSKPVSSSVSCGMAASACSMALSMAFCSLSSSTTMASMPRPVWNLISSMACRLVGIGHAEEQAFAAPEQRQAAMLLQQLVLNQLDGVQVDVVRVEVEQRNAEFGRSGDGDVTRLGGAGGDELGDEAGLRSFAACSALSMAASSTTPSCTSLCGRPPRLERFPPSARDALSFMRLRASETSRWGP